ncbi:replication protein RepA [Escherichia coli]|nr:replication protein RepA [Escherichia coli]PBT06800.1 replication protein RepA [Escherichia coli]PBT08137.1 replication protein RepA [Escherichia coli]PBT13077.1 replication protein RepA [Escherichia coli]PBT17551.1 replication protein RepA [Escherichia coli]
MLAPVIFLDSPKLEKIIGVFAFLAPEHPHQNQFPATLRRGQPQNSLKRSAIYHAHQKQARM